MRFIAEIGLNYNGDFDLAHELIRQAKLAGADVAKFQLGWRCEKGEINHIEPSDLMQLKEWCDESEITFMVSIFTEEAYRMAQKAGFTCYKIASRTVKDNLDLVRRIAKEGKETFISLGMWDGERVPIENADNVKYLWCKAKYPAQTEDMLDFPKSFKGDPYFGYSDHTVGTEWALKAISRGAEIIEKHFTLDKTDTTIRDHMLSATPDEFKRLVKEGRDINKAALTGIK